MAAYFLDSSALVKLYLAETGSSWLKSLTGKHRQHSFYIARVTQVEVVSALTRRGRAGSFTPAGLTATLAQFRLDLPRIYVPVEITQAIIKSGMALAETHGLRGYDAVQLAAALEIYQERIAFGLSSPTLVSADTDLNAAGEAEGLQVANPNNH